MRKRTIPKYLQLKKEMIAWIHSGKLKPHDKLQSENELTELFQLSRQTVRQAIGEMVNEGMMYRIQGKGTFIANPANRSDDQLATVGLITTYISDYIFPLIVRGTESTLREKNCRLILSSTDNDKGKERECLEMMMSQPLSGLILEPTKSAEGNPNLNYFLNLESRGIPYLMINERYPELDCPCIRVDDEWGGYAATEHLIKLGHTKITGLFKTDDLQGLNRLKGFLRAHRDYRIPTTDHSVVRYTTEEKGDKPLAEAARLLASSERPTAFVCYNDELAVTILDVVRGAGLSVPQDLSITGFDDSFLAMATEVKLTTLRHPKIEMGQLAARLLIDLIEKKKSMSSIGVLTVKPELLIRSSTRKI